MSVLVTGADGFLGEHITTILLREGYSVRAMRHPESSRRPIPAHPNLEVVDGDLLRPETLAAALDGTDRVIHSAAKVTLYPRRQRMVREINLQGVRNLAGAAARVPVGRFVCIGTANSFGSGTLEKPGTEESPYTDGRFGFDYMDSKKAAQDWLLELHRNTGFPVIILNPCWMLGPGDCASGSGLMLIRLRRSPVIPVTRGGRNFVDVRDVARAAVNALTMGRTGECYICGNENLPYSRALPLFAEMMNRNAPVLRIPAPAAWSAGLFGSIRGLLSRREPAVSLTMARAAVNDSYYSSEKARRELGLPATPVRQTAADAYAWLKENGHCD